MAQPDLVTLTVPPLSSQPPSTSSTSSQERIRTMYTASPLSSSHPNHSEGTTTPASILIPIDAVSRHDILPGRGNGVGQHFGNIEFRKIISAHAEAYRSTMDSNKKKLVVAEIQNKVEKVHRGRFLAQVEDMVGMYRPLNLTEIRHKIQQALRDTIKKSKIKRHNQY